MFLPGIHATFRDMLWKADEACAGCFGERQEEISSVVLSPRGGGTKKPTPRGKSPASFMLAFYFFRCRRRNPLNQ
jgi:hypothetical protein